jgi:hypothetical protein
MHGTVQRFVKFLVKKPKEKRLLRKPKFRCKNYGYLINMANGGVMIGLFWLRIWTTYRSSHS